MYELECGPGRSHVQGAGLSSGRVLKTNAAGAPQKLRAKRYCGSSDAAALVILRETSDVAGLARFLRGGEGEEARLRAAGEAHGRVNRVTEPCTHIQVCRTVRVVPDAESPSLQVWQIAV